MTRALLIVYGVIALVVIGIIFYFRNDLKDMVQRGLNPLSPDNYVYKSATAVTTAVLGRDESPGTAAYEGTSIIGGLWRSLTGGFTTDDVDYSKPVTPQEKAMVSGTNPPTNQ
jgi:hypothetical protein